MRRAAVFLRHLDLYRFPVYVIIFSVRDNRQGAWNCRNGEIWNGHRQNEKRLLCGRIRIPGPEEAVDAYKEMAVKAISTK